jgi:hypothetical protein
MHIYILYLYYTYNIQTTLNALNHSFLTFRHVKLELGLEIERLEEIIREKNCLIQSYEKTITAFKKKVNIFIYLMNLFL